jgi:hypothetical protein
MIDIPSFSVLLGDHSSLELKVESPAAHGVFPVPVTMVSITV